MRFECCRAPLATCVKIQEALRISIKSQLDVISLPLLLDRSWILTGMYQMQNANCFSARRRSRPRASMLTYRECLRGRFASTHAILHDVDPRSAFGDLQAKSLEICVPINCVAGAYRRRFNRSSCELHFYPSNHAAITETYFAKLEKSRKLTENGRFTRVTAHYLMSEKPQKHVEHLSGGVGVGGSNPLVPTNLPSISVENTGSASCPFP